jgi:hypothetical protein
MLRHAENCTREGATLLVIELAGLLLLQQRQESPPLVASPLSHRSLEAAATLAGLSASSASGECGGGDDALMDG